MPGASPILLVEDSSDDVELALSALARNGLVSDVVVAHDGTEALDFIFRRGAHQGRTTRDPVFILLDLKMPKVNGLDVLKTLKADDRLRTIPVVMLTSSEEETDLVKSYQLGVNSFVVKPLNFLKFVEVIGQLGTFWGAINRTAPIPVPAAT